MTDAVHPAVSPALPHGADRADAPADADRLPRRDLWLLPLISLLTLLVLFAGTEAAVRLVWPEQLVNACRAPDAVLGFRHVPNCSAAVKAAEGPWLTMDYNECGYRSATSCGPVPADTRRLALLGTSAAEGYMVPYGDTLGARLAIDLSALCGRPVDVQNLGGVGYFGRRLTLRMAEALKLHPDAVLLVVTPFDLETGFGDVPEPASANASAVPPPVSLRKRLMNAVKESRFFAVAQHYMFRNPSIYVPLFLGQGDKADFLRQPFTPAWDARLRLFDALAGQLQDQAKAAGIPFALAFEPQEAQVVLMAGHYPMNNARPAALPDAVASIARARGIGFEDMSPALLQWPEPERLFYQALSHLGPEGQVIGAAAIARGVPDELGGRFAACRGQLGR